MAKIHIVSADVKRQILDRVKEGGKSIAEIAEEHVACTPFLVNSFHSLADKELIVNSCRP